MTGCPNCRTEARGTFCPECGQAQGPLLPTFGEVVRDLFDSLFLVDARLPKTLKLLIARPGFLTREWADGRRNRYVAPIRLYLAAAVVFFFIWPLAGEMQGQTILGVFGSYFEGFAEGYSFSRAGDGAAPVPSAEAQRLMATHVVSALQYMLLFLSVPLLALLNFGRWGEGTSSMVLQLTFSLHYHTVMLFVLTVATGLGTMLGVAVVDDLMLLIMLAFLVLSIRGAFRTTWRQATLRGVVLFMLQFAAAISAALFYAQLKGSTG